MPVIAPVINWSATSATLAFIFVWWHTWNYDKWRSDDWFRTLILYVHVVGLVFFVASQWMDVHVAYQQAFVTIGINVVPAPWQFWPDNLKSMFKASAYLMTVMFWALQIAHAEEMIFWGYLIRAIRNPNYANSPNPQIWVKSSAFKVWLTVALFSGALLWGAVNIETENLDMMRAYLYLVNSAIALLLSIGSLVMCFYLPAFIQRIKDFGAGFEMQERLAVFKELHVIRTIARLLYSTCFIMLSGDMISGHKRILSSKFATSFVAVAGQAGIIVVFGLSIIILLPRNMDLESAGPGTKASFHPMMSAYKRPTADRLANHHFWEMGQRLNLEQDALAAILPEHRSQAAPTGLDRLGGLGGLNGHGYELSHSTSNHQHQLSPPVHDKKRLSFSTGLGQSQGSGSGGSSGNGVRRGSVRNIQEMMGRLAGMDSQRASMPHPPTKIIVTTHEEQRSD